MKTFEDILMNKIATIINLYNTYIKTDIHDIYLYIYSNTVSDLVTAGFKTYDNKLVYIHNVGITDEIDNKIFDCVIDDILPDIKDLCIKYKRPVPIEYRIIYNKIMNSCKVDYKYEVDCDENYICDKEAYSFIHSFE